MRSSYTFAFLVAFCAIGSWALPAPKSTMYYCKDFSDEVDPDTGVTKRTCA
jgi:hypothetical protein